MMGRRGGAAGRECCCHPGADHRHMPSLVLLPACLCVQEKKRINKEGELVITSQRTRSQA